ncbi:MAG: sensor histidine kinase [Vulcanimicrobiota bacterium]
MDNEEMTTSFAPAERLSREEVLAQRERIYRFPFLKRILDSSPNLLSILNQERQIVFASEALIKFLGVPDMECLIALRPGEMLHCNHADENRAGCGTTKFCEMCGVVNAIVESQKGAEAISECRILKKNADALDLGIWSTPFEIEGEWFTFFTLQDKSGEKRRRSLERIFFHDVMNTIGGLYGYADLLVESMPQESEARTFADNIFSMTESVIEDVQSQKDLMAAENNELVVNTVEVDSLAIVNDVAASYRVHQVAQKKIIAVAPDSTSVKFRIDRTLLKRIIGNMTKNALEASKAGDTVTLSCYDMGNSVIFNVHNKSFMPREAQLQVFNRSFSTKGAGRGLGTYSIKLLTERYLKGSASFITSEHEGTTFKASFPKLT